MSVLDAFKRFMANATTFENAVDLSTSSSYVGKLAKLELFDDGRYRFVPDHALGNRYDSDGMVISIPALNSEDDADEDCARFYGNAAETMREWFDAAWQESIEYQSELANAACC